MDDILAQLILQRIMEETHSPSSGDNLTDPSNIDVEDMRLRVPIDARHITHRKGIVILTSSITATIISKIKLAKHIWEVEGFFAFTDKVRCMTLTLHIFTIALPTSNWNNRFQQRP